MLFNTTKYTIFLTLFIGSLLSALLTLYFVKQKELKSTQPVIISEQQSKDEKQRISAYKQRISNDTKDYPAYIGLGIEYYIIGDLKLARKTLNDAITVDPALYIAYANLGDVTRDMGDYVVAEEAYKKAIARAPRKANLYEKLILLYVRIDNDAMIESTYIAGLSNTENDINLFTSYAAWLEQKNRLKESLSVWKKALQQAPNDESIQREIKDIDIKINAVNNE